MSKNALILLKSRKKLPSVALLPDLHWTSAAGSPPLIDPALATSHDEFLDYTRLP